MIIKSQQVFRDTSRITYVPVYQSVDSPSYMKIYTGRGKQADRNRPGTSAPLA